MAQASPKPAKYQPRNVQDYAEATRRARCVPCRSPKGPEAQHPQLERLPGQGQPNDSYGQAKAASKVANGGLKPAKKQPQDVANKSHDSSVFQLLSPSRPVGRANLRKDLCRDLAPLI